MTLFLLLIIFALLCLAYWGVHQMAAASSVPGIVVVIMDIILLVVFVVCVLRFAGVAVPGLP